ncbi:MAG: hypothetical protein KC503_22775 [Myxococcales bacterium]|nr:hypothetical protein [Myxococcales bacterium]
MKRLSCALLLALALAACGSARPVTVERGPGDDVGYPGEGTTVVIVDGVTYVVGGDPGVDCVDFEGECISIGDVKNRECGSTNAQADVVVVDGKVVEVICYPPRSAGQDIGEVGENKDGTVTVPQNAGHTVITFKPETNGTATDGDLTIDGEGVALIGNGVDKTIIGGNLKIASNKSVIRGLTVQGNVTFEKNSNNASISFCKVYGNLEVHSNDTSVIACQVFGNVEVKGNNDTVVYTGVGNNFKVDGKLAVCAGNYGFDDQNDDHIVDVAEETGEIACK